MYVVMPLVGIVLMLVVPVVAIIFWKKILPKSARTLFWCKRRNMPPLLIVHDSGRAEITMISELEGGAVMTRSGKFKLLPRFLVKRDLKGTTGKTETTTPATPKEAPVVADGSPPSPVRREEPELRFISPEEKSALEKLPPRLQDIYNRYFPDYSNIISRRCHLKGLGGLPFFLGYSGTACLMNPEALILYEAGEMAVQMNDVMKFNPNGIEGKTIAGVSQPLMIYDARVIKALIPETYDETQITAIATKSEMIGLLGRGLGRYIPVITIVVIIVLAILGLMFVAPMLSG